ncbi:hypothetical protein M378DRAFT_465403 [Amanita muscaria Koide BX008]|uniref:Uncharacterized protein n=1 Tax=Amanita muscaria (strain Koide BX008) TaxID=946122 RepID=A0A0C2WK99_AMAMK|nr:hypothetical protein M378DRAFT_465403 [Amanita muscaria Koide BX008]
MRCTKALSAARKLKTCSPKVMPEAKCHQHFSYATVAFRYHMTKYSGVSIQARIGASEPQIFHPQSPPLTTAVYYCVNESKCLCPPSCSQSQMGSS